MTEHCINNGTSRCQTKDATHLAVKYKDFSYNNSVGFTYKEKKAELMFHFVADPDITDDKLTLYVTSISDRPWYVYVYDNPYDNTSNFSLKLLPPAPESLKLYSIRDFEFSKRDELIIFIRFNAENLLDLEEVIEEEETVRLWECLNSIFEESTFADMMVENETGSKMPAHRAVIAAVSDVLDKAVSSLQLIEDDDDDNSTDGEFSNTESEESKENTEEVVDNGVELHHLTAAIAKAFNVSFDKSNSLIQYMRNNINGDIKLPTPNDTELDEISFIKPNPKNYSMVLKGVNSTEYMKELLRYMYVSHFKYIDVDVKWHDLHDLMNTAVSYKMENFIDDLELQLISSVYNGTVSNVLDLAIKMNLEKLRLTAIKHIRSFGFIEYSKIVEEPDIHKCILASPTHNYRDYIYFTVTLSVDYEKKFDFGAVKLKLVIIDQKCHFHYSFNENVLVDLDIKFVLNDDQTCVHFNDRVFFDLRLAHTADDYRLKRFDLSRLLQSGKDSTNNDITVKVLIQIVRL